MTRQPYGPDELDRHDPALDDAAAQLEAYASATGGEPPMDLAVRIRTAIEAEPPVPMGWWATFLAWRNGVPARAAAVAGVIVLAVAGALALGELARNARFDNVGTSPEPSAVPVPSSTTTEEAAPSLIPSPSDLPSALPSPTVAPTPTERETAEPSHDDGVTTPTPSESDHSGPGGGGSGSGSGSSGTGSSGSGSDD